MPKRPRRHPYTERGIARIACFRCGQPSSFQWQICADGSQYRGLCPSCDVGLNALVLRWMGAPEAEQKIAAYARQKEVPWPQPPKLP